MSTCKETKREKWSRRNEDEMAVGADMKQRESWWRM